MLATVDEQNQARFKVFQLVWFELYFVWSLSSDLSGTSNPIRNIESPARTASQVMEARQLFHRVKMIDTIIHRKELKPFIILVVLHSLRRCL